jgi:hypothetical protein
VRKTLPANQSVVGWLGGQWHPQSTKVQISGLTLWCLINKTEEYSSVRGDVPVDSEASVMTSSISSPVGSVFWTHSVGGARRGRVYVHI